MMALAEDDPRAIHPPYFATCLLLSFLLPPVGLVAGLVYLCLPKWRSAGGVMLAAGLLSGLTASMVFLSIR
jgi:hypothetical protein